MSEPEILPWDRQHREPEKAYGYFALDRDLGRTRTVAKVAEQVHKSRDYLHKLATTWKWVQRAQAWDREEDRLYAESLAEQRRPAVRTDGRPHADPVRGLRPGHVDRPEPADGGDARPEGYPAAVHGVRAAGAA
jgi:hypothetical protein